jgi:hypothetical protein
MAWIALVYCLKRKEVLAKISKEPLVALRMLSSV